MYQPFKNTTTRCLFRLHICHCIGYGFCISVILRNKFPPKNNEYEERLNICAWQCYCKIMLLNIKYVKTLSISNNAVHFPLVYEFKS